MSQERVRPREARELVNPGQMPYTGLIIFSMKQRYNKRSNSTIGKHCLHGLRLKEHIYWKLVRRVSYMNSFNLGINLIIEIHKAHVKWNGFF